MADGLLRRKVKELDLPVIVDSAGTANYHTGCKPDERMCQTGNKNGTTIDSLRARQFNVLDFDNFDVIYAMDNDNFRNIIQISKTDDQRNKVKLLLNELYPGENLAVPDPYYGTLADFQAVYDLLDQATDVVITKIQHGTIR